MGLCLHVSANTCPGHWGDFSVSPQEQLHNPTFELELSVSSSDNEGRAGIWCWIFLNGCLTFDLAFLL